MSEPGDMLYESLYDALYGVPVDAGVVAIRAGPPTPLLVRPMQDGVRAQLFVAQPASWAPLSLAARAALEPYFDWQRGDTHWWRTLHPAVFTMERIAPGVIAGHCRERGSVIHAGDDPGRHPDAEHVFQVCRAAPEAIIHDPLGPVEYRDLAGVTEVYRAPAVRMLRATFPTLGPETIWLRLFAPGAERDAHRRALDAELEAVRVIARLVPELVPEILHDGQLDTTRYAGRYVAARPSPGLVPDDAFLVAGRLGFPPVRQLVREVVADVALVIAAAHAVERCVGLLSPMLLRVRPIPGATGSRAGARLVALPAAGEIGGSVPKSSIELYPEGDAHQLAEQFRQPFRRSPAADIASLGILIAWLVERSGEPDPRLQEFAMNLVHESGGRSAEVVATSLHAMATALSRSSAR